MFSSNKKKSFSGKIETLISQDTYIEGTIESSGTLRIDGTVKGGIKKADGVIVGENGIVEGDINSKGVSLAGRIRGNVYSEVELELLPGSTLTGDIETSKLSIAEGAHFDGVCTMIEEDSTGRRKKQGTKKEKEESSST